MLISLIDDPDDLALDFSNYQSSDLVKACLLKLSVGIILYYILDYVVTHFALFAMLWILVNESFDGEQIHLLFVGSDMIKGSHEVEGKFLVE